jgi:hypothetical protein
MQHREHQKVHHGHAMTPATLKTFSGMLGGEQLSWRSPC